MGVIDWAFLAEGGAARGGMVSTLAAAECYVGREGIAGIDGTSSKHAFSCPHLPMM